MPNPTPEAAAVVRGDGGEHIPVMLSLNPRAFATRGRNVNGEMAADRLEQLARGDRSAALGATLSSLLDLMASGQPGAAANAVAASLELARRIVAERAAQRAAL